MTVARLLEPAAPMASRLDAKKDVAPATPLESLTRVSQGPSTPLWNLTPQQWRVFLLIGKALSNKAIAHELKVAESTVKAHVSAIFKLAGCRNRTEAALLSQRVRFGLVDDDERGAMRGSRPMTHELASVSRFR